MTHRACSSMWTLILLLFALSTVSGCLVQSTPDYKDPPALQPRLLLYKAQPPITQVVQLQGQTESFLIPIHPEDVGYDYQTWVYLDYRVEGEQYLDFDDTDVNEDTIRFTLPDRGISVGCHQLTILTARDENTDFDNRQPIDSQNAAMATWWIDKLPEGETSATLMRDCPSIQVP